jgi:hypothetical protein
MGKSGKPLSLDFDSAIGIFGNGARSSLQAGTTGSRNCLEKSPRAGRHKVATVIVRIEPFVVSSIARIGRR